MELGATLVRGQAHILNIRSDKKVKPHYFAQEKPDEDDLKLKMCIGQGYIPQGCLLNGDLVWALIMDSKDPCKSCAGPREKCKGRPEK